MVARFLMRKPNRSRAGMTKTANRSILSGILASVSDPTSPLDSLYLGSCSGAGLGKVPLYCPIFGFTGAPTRPWAEALSMNPMLTATVTTAATVVFSPLRIRLRPTGQLSVIIVPSRLL